MTEHRYPWEGLRADYVRAGAGFAMTAVPLAVVPFDSIAAPVLAGFALVFAAFGAQTALRQASRVVMDEDGLALHGPFSRRIAWGELTVVRLRYFATRRDRRGGWMQLIVAGPRGRVRLDSTLADFPAIVRRASLAARENGIPLAPSTLDNLRNIGITVQEPGWGTGRGSR